MLTKENIEFSMVLQVPTITKDKKSKNMYLLRLRCTIRKRKNGQQECRGSAVAFFEDENMTNKLKNKLVLADNNDVFNVKKYQILEKSTHTCGGKYYIFKF